MEIALRVSLYRAVDVPDAPADVPDTSQCTEQQQAIADCIMASGYATSSEVSALLEVGERRARVVLSEMVEKGFIVQVGAARSTKYVMRGSALVDNGKGVVGER